MRIFGIVGHSGMGKTTLLERLIPELVQRRLSVSLVKHSHKSIDIDRPGKDSHRLREAGCDDVVIVGKDRWAVTRELRGDPEPAFEEILAAVRPCDVLLVEGMKSLAYPKLEVWRAGLDRAPLWPSHPEIIALASDQAVVAALAGPLPVVRLSDVCGIADLVLRSAAAPRHQRGRPNADKRPARL
jgi:molybdopterin-guanine dinucleotide biosynthesis protein B